MMRSKSFLVVVVVVASLKFFAPLPTYGEPRGSMSTIHVLNTTLLPRWYVTESLRRTGLRLKVDYKWTLPVTKCTRERYPTIYSSAATCYARLLLRRRKGLTLVIAPPFYLSSGQRAIGGVSVGSCNPTGFAIIFYDWHYSRKILKTIVAHELGHLLGAKHDNRLPVSYMNENAIPYYPTTYSNKSKKEIWNCLIKMK